MKVIKVKRTFIIQISIDIFLLFDYMHTTVTISQLQKQYQNAINSLDFEKAEQLNHEISLMKKVPLDVQYKIPWKQYSQITQSKTKKKTIKKENKLPENLNHEYFDTERSKIISKYDNLYQNLILKHQQEQYNLNEQYQNKLQREKERSIEQVDQLQLQSKHYAFHHDYFIAKQTYKDSCAVQETILQERIHNVERNYNKAKEILKKQQENELQLHEQKRQEALDELDHKIQKTNSIKENRNKVIVLRS